MYKLTVLTDLSTLPSEIHSNYDAVKAELADTLKKYDGLVVTDENFQDMKKTRAEINSGITVLRSVGTDVKKKLLAPFGAFDTKVKELIALAEEKKDALDKQIKAIEAKRRADKEADLQAFVKDAVHSKAWPKDFDEANPYFTGLVTSHPEWLNVSCSLTKGKAEIQAIVDGAFDALEQITRIYANDTEVVKVKAFMYITTNGFDVGKACERVNAFLDEEKRLAEARRRDEEARLAREAELKAQEERMAALREAAEAAKANRPEPAPAPPEPPPVAAPQTPMDAAKDILRRAREAAQQSPAIPDAAPAEPPTPAAPAPASVETLRPTVYRMEVAVTCSCAQLHALKDFFGEKGIGYEVLKQPVPVAG